MFKSNPLRKAALAGAVVSLALLAGCQQPTAAGTATTGASNAQTAPVGFLAKGMAFTQADLANAIDIATKAGPAGQEIVSCFSFLQANLTALQTATSGVATGQATVGAASVFTVGALGLSTAVTATSGSNQMAFEIACGPLGLHLANQGLTLAQQVQALAGMIALAPK